MSSPGYNAAMSDVTRILSAIERGDEQASDKLLPLVYQELRKLAAAKLSNEKPGQTLEPTALVHEAYLKLLGGEDGKQWDGRGHFFVAAAESMRRILIDNARRKKAVRHGGAMVRICFAPELAVAESDDDLIALDTALERLSNQAPVKADLIKLRYFSGLKMAEAAAFLNISIATAERYWAYSRAWLHQEVIRIRDESE